MGNNISNETQPHHLAIIEMTQSHHSSHDYPQSRSRLVVDDLSAQLAPLQMYGLAKLTSVVVDGFVVLAAASRKGLRHAGWTSSTLAAQAIIWVIEQAARMPIRRMPSACRCAMGRERSRRL